MRQKQLNVTGNNIIKYELGEKNSQVDGHKITTIYLSISVNDDGDDRLYKYEICGDDRFTHNYLLTKIRDELDFAIKNYAKVSINEYSERNYLFFEVHNKDFRKMQVTGKRL